MSKGTTNMYPSWLIRGNEDNTQEHVFGLESRQDEKMNSNECEDKQWTECTSEIYDDEKDIDILLDGTSACDSGEYENEQKEKDLSLDSAARMAKDRVEESGMKDGLDSDETRHECKTEEHKGGESQSDLVRNSRSTLQHNKKQETKLRSSVERRKGEVKNTSGCDKADGKKVERQTLKKAQKTSDDDAKTLPLSGKKERQKRKIKYVAMSKKKSKKDVIEDLGSTCSQCQTKNTPLWRIIGKCLYCNACGLRSLRAKNGRTRPKTKKVKEGAQTKQIAKKKLRKRGKAKGTSRTPRDLGKELEGKNADNCKSEENAVEEQCGFKYDEASGELRRGSRRRALSKRMREMEGGQMLKTLLQSQSRGPETKSIERKPSKKAKTSNVSIPKEEDASIALTMLSQDEDVQHDGDLKIKQKNNWSNVDIQKLLHTKDEMDEVDIIFKMHHMCRKSIFDTAARENSSMLWLAIILRGITALFASGKISLEDKTFLYDKVAGADDLFLRSLPFAAQTLDDLQEMLLSFLKVTKVVQLQEGLNKENEVQHCSTMTKDTGHSQWHQDKALKPLEMRETNIYKHELLMTPTQKEPKPIAMASADVSENED